MTFSRRKFIKRMSTAGGAALTASFASSGNTSNATEAEVVIIGSGPAGLGLADKLSASGVDVLLIESGVSKPDQQHQSLNTVTGSLMPVEQGLGVAGRRAIGGTTHVWGGVCPRYAKSDFRTMSDFGYGMDWPISFEEISRYYCAAEQWLRVSDVQCGQVKQSPFIKSSGRLSDALSVIGVSELVPAAMSVNSRGLAKPFNLGSLVTGNLSFRRTFRMLDDLTARRLDINNNGEILGVHCSSFDGDDSYVGAKTVVLCCGAIQNARLLLLSRSSVYRDGVGNSEGHVGSWFMDHPSVHYWVEPKSELLDEGDLATFVHSSALYNRMKSAGMGSALLRFGAYHRNWRALIGTTHLPESRGQAAAQQSLIIEALCEQEPQKTNRISLSKNGKDEFGDHLAHLEFSHSKRDKLTLDFAGKKIQTMAEELGHSYMALPVRLSSHHLMGTTRMGSSEKDSVVDENLKVHGVKNLYIAGGSVFPTGGGANPTLTLTALAFRLADHLISARKGSVR